MCKTKIIRYIPRQKITTPKFSMVFFSCYEGVNVVAQWTSFAQKWKLKKLLFVSYAC